MTDERRDEAAKEFRRFNLHKPNEIIFDLVERCYQTGWNQCRETEIGPLQKRIAELETQLQDLDSWVEGVSAIGKNCDKILLKRFLSRVNRTETCWLWGGYIAPHGYGAFTVDSRNIRAHKWIYEQTYGPVAPGLFVCHRCNVKICVNPAHLYIGTPKQNSRDAVRDGRYTAWRPLCKNGHPFSGDNLYTYTTSDGASRRECRICRTNKNKEYRGKKHERRRLEAGL